MEQLQSQLRQQLAGSRYLLVLDDVWTEDRHQWCELVKYLIGGQRGSWVMVTTRSQETATIIHGEVYKLQGLSQGNSWNLFKKTAFASDLQHNPPDDLVNIGRKIVDLCVGVPLAIKVAGSLVYGQEKSKWLSVQNNAFARISDAGNTIMPILKLSYHHLASPLKSCFSYCAMFPKDHQIDKEMLKSLWMAQGYIVPLDYGQSIGDAAEEYFSILLKRCFFQDIERNDYGDIRSCKIHDLMHDIAQSVSRKEIYALNSSNNANLDSIKIRHLSMAGAAGIRRYVKYPSGKTQIRSHLFVVDPNVRSIFFLPLEALVTKFKWLRALDFSRCHSKKLPESIGRLLHLRYLDLSGNKDLEMLPKSITTLCNLQTLNLNDCRELKELPKHLGSLVKLRVLDIMGCYSLTHMPRGMGKLSNLEWLYGEYILGGEGNNRSTRKEWFYGLEDLSTLNNLKGQLHIKIKWPNNLGEEEDSWSWRAESNSCLRSMQHLHSLRLHFRDGGDRDGRIRELLMEELQPHSNLKQLSLFGYHGVKLPGWFSNPTSLPHLVSLRLQDLEEFTGVGEEVISSNPQSQQSPLLPCLSTLTISHCPKLVDLPNWTQYCSSLQEIKVVYCRKLESIPNWMPKLTSLQNLTLESCSKILERRCQRDPPGKDWPHIQHIPAFSCLYALW